MKFKIHKITIILFAFVLVSCKKKSVEGTNNATIQNTPDPKEVYGFFQTVKQYSLYNDTLKVENGFTSVAIYDSLVKRDFFGYGQGIDVGSLSANSSVLKKGVNINVQPHTYFYYDTLYSVINKPCNWSIAGNNIFPPFTFYDDLNYPSYLGYDNLPDTLFSGKPNIILINSYYGAERIEITFRSGSNSITKILNPPSNSVVFSSDDIGQLQWWSNQFVDLRINFFKNSFKQIGNKNYQLNTATYFWKGGIYYKQ